MAETFTFVPSTSFDLDDINNKILKSFSPGSADNNSITEPIAGFGLCAKIIGPAQGSNHTVIFYDYQNDLLLNEQENIEASIDLQEEYQTYKNSIGTFTINIGANTHTYTNCLLEEITIERLKMLLTITFSFRQLGSL